MNEREKRMLQMGAIAVVLIGIFGYGTKAMDRWNQSRTSLAAAKRRLSEVETDPAKLAGLIAQVPVFTMPEPEEKQKTLFREKLYEQLKKAGINPEPPQPILSKKINIAGTGYRVLKIKCKAKCKLPQLLDFLAALKENPYLVGVEELRMQCDMKEPPERRKDKDVEIDLTVSTFIKETLSRPGEAKSVQYAKQSSR
ncbi:MAG: hypothetical protein FJ280_14770 [Planctomycetes bacterium]|nr:hypothetical protein [Planctomycetota bacterium]